MSTARDRKRQARSVERLQPWLDDAFPPRGDCGVCGSPEDPPGSLGARHRIIDSVAELVRAGEPPDVVAREYGVNVEAVALALAVSW